MKKRIIIKTIIICIPIIFILVKFGQYAQKCEKECVAYTITSAILFQDEIYFDNDTYVNKHWNGEMAKCYGNILSRELYDCRNRTIKSFLGYTHYLLKATLWVDESDKEYTHIYRRGGISGGYSKSSFLEEEERIKEIFKEVSSFIVLNEDPDFEQRCCLIDKEILVELEKEFGECEYYVDDFLEMEASYFVYVNPYFYDEGTIEELKRFCDEMSLDASHYISTIFTDKEGNLYYCNRDNLIEGELADKIKEIFGGEWIYAPWY